MSVYLGDFNPGDTVRFMWNSNGSNGASITRATNGTISVYQNLNTTQTTTGVTDTEDFDGLTGVHAVAIDTSQDGTFYAAGRDFAVVLSGATIDGQTVNAVLAHFSIQNRNFLRPTTAGRTLDVSATGEAGVDWANVGSPTTTLNLSGTTVKTATDIETDTQDIQGRLPAALISGRMDSNLQAAANNVITSSVIATDAIGAAQIAADAIGSSELATSAVAEIQSGLSTLTAGQVNAEVVDALATDTYAEPGQGAPAATTTLAAKINYLYKAWRNKSTQTSTTYNLFADDASTVDQKATVSDDSTTFTKGEIATGP